MRGTRKLLRTRHRNGRSEEQGDAARAALRAIQRHEPGSTRDDAESPRSIDQPLNSASFHSIEGMHNIALVEHREQALDSAHRVVLAGFDILRQDATSILHRAQYRFLVGRVQTELLAQQNRELKQRPADSFQSTCCVITGGPSPDAARCFSCCPRCATRTGPLHGRGLQAPCVPTDRVRVNAAHMREVIVRCGYRFENTRISHTSKTLFFGWRLRPSCGTLLAK
jgi:hypothetical protein